VIDVATPTAPVEVGVYDEPLAWLYATDVLVAGNHAYLTNRSGDMPIVDISDPSAPREVGSIPAGKALALAGGYAFSIIGGGCGDPCAPSSLFVVDISKPAMGSGVVGSYQWYSPQPFIDVAAADGYVYVAAGAGGLRVFDVSNPAAPVEVASYDTPGSAERVVVAGDSIYIADGPGGLAILRRMPTRAARPTRVASETKAAVTTEATATPTYSYSGYALPPTTPLTVGETQLPPAWLIVGSEAIPATYGAVRTPSGPVGIAPAQAPAEVSISVPAASEVVIGSPAVSAFQARVRDQSEESAVLDLHGVVQRRGNLMSLMLDEIDPPMGTGKGGAWLLVVSVTFNDGYTVDYLWRLNAVPR